MEGQCHWQKHDQCEDVFGEEVRGQIAGLLPLLNLVHSQIQRRHQPGGRYPHRLINAKRRVRGPNDREDY